MTEEEEAQRLIEIAKEEWNAEADQYNQWGDLDLVEKVVLILRNVT